MPTKLSRYADGLIEAVWLAAIVLIPVFFNVYSSRIFEPDKIALLRSLALLGLGAWIVRLIEEGGLRSAPEGGRLRALLGVPLMPAVLSLAAVYLIATAFSVTPRVSLLGSYQRLQGTYTTFSYLVLFSLVAAHLRRREQIDRLVTTVVLASLPVGLYGIIQKFGIDPIPWGGDTARRVASNMGNAIFVAAYLIMAFPLAVGRIVDSFAHILDERVTDLFPQIVRGTVYVFAAAIQLIALYFTLSRGPILGLLAGTFFLIVLLSLYWNRRWLTITSVAVAAALGIFLVVFAIPGGPLDRLRSNENIGRIGNVFQTDTGTGLVRTLIWRGAAELVWFHDPLEYPDGRQDTLNALRPLIGYGPESMYVAFNPFYPAELASVESRNASPDRSHNETWDALVITGLLGLVAEQFVFLSLFYYGLKWLGLIDSPRRRSLFLGLILGGGALSGLAFSLLLDVGYLGVGLPFGMLLGLLAYLTLTSVFSRYEPPQTAGERARALTLMMFLGAIIAHYVEIHFGIAIAATRMHFWLYAGVLLSAGYWMTRGGAYGAVAQARLAGEPVVGLEDAVSPAEAVPVKGRKLRGRAAGRSPGSAWRQHAWAGGITSGILLAALMFNFTGNTNNLSSIGGIIRQSLTTLPNQQYAVSYGILAIFLTFFLAFAATTASEWSRQHPGEWRAVFLTTAGVSFGVWLLYSILHASSMIAIIRSAAPIAGDVALDPILRQAGALESLLTYFYFAVLVLVLFLAARLAAAADAGQKANPSGGSGLAVAAGVLLLVLVLSWQTNLRVVHADIAFKIADPYGRGTNPDNWTIAVELYQRANQYAPQEDHYYLFLGRAYLELTRAIAGQDPLRAQELLRQAETDLLRAQRINPLNTDHTANLGRLYRFWSSVPGGSESPRQLLEKADTFYSRAVVLSPNNAGIWNEWGVLQMQDLGNEARGLELLLHSLEIDPQFHGTYGILGDYFGRQARAAGDDEQALRRAVTSAVFYYTAAYSRTTNTQSRYLYAAALGGVHGLVDDHAASIQAYLDALENADPTQVWLVEDTIAKVFAQAEDYEAALEYAQRSLANAPPEQQAAQQELITHILGLQAGGP